MRTWRCTAYALLLWQAAAWSEESLVDAVRAANREAAIALIEKRADVNAPMADGTTPLHWAAHNGDADLVKRLLKAGAQATARNEYGATPMSEAAERADAAIIKLLL